MDSKEYVHGYTERETRRLQEQSLILEELLHKGTSFAPGSRVLEVGCGVGAQTMILLRRNPGIRLTSMDMSLESVQLAKKQVEAAGYEGMEFRHENIFAHGLAPRSFDHVFVCFVLEHMEEPLKALEQMMKLLKAGGTISLIEGDHSSGKWTPETSASRAAWNGLVTSQQMLGHDPNIGNRLLPLMRAAGVCEPRVKPLEAYADQRVPEILDGAINQIIAPMVYSAEKHILKNRLVEPHLWKQGLKDISAVASHPEGTFFYSWFKGTGIQKNG